MGKCGRFNGVQKTISFKRHYQTSLGWKKMKRRTVGSFFIQQQTFIISFCLTKLMDEHGKFNGQQKLKKGWFFVSINLALGAKIEVIDFVERKKV